MLKTLLRLLGTDARLLHRYAAWAISYGIVCGISLALLVPVLSHLLNGHTTASLRWLAVLLGTVLLGWVWRHRVEKAGVRVGVALLQGGRHRIGEHVATLPVGWFNPANSARLGHAVSHGMMAAAQLPAHVFTPLITGVVTPLVLLVMMFVLYPPLGWAALLALPLLLFAFRLSAKLSRRADAHYQQQFAAASQRMVEFAQAQPVLRAFGGDDAGTGLLRQAVDRQHRSGLRLILQSSLAAVLNAWAVQAVFAVLLLIVMRWLHLQLLGEVPLPELVATIVTLLVLVRFIDPLLEVAGYSEVLRNARGQLDASAALLDCPPLSEPAQPRHPADGSLQLRDVQFAYAGQSAPLLRGVNLQVPAGSMLALVGSSGSGKSTVLRLIARYFDVQQGSVSIGGVDVRDIASSELAAQISQIFQDSYLFSGSIADNLRLGCAAASEQQLHEAIQQAGLDTLIARLPQGLHTPVGEGGSRLSGGERQRLTIARALLKDAPILLVDEATAALDAQNQASIAELLARLRGQRTLVVIAHQLSTIAMADQVAVLEAGQIVEYGSPAQLRARDGLFARFLQQRQHASGWRIGNDHPGHVCER